MKRNDLVKRFGVEQRSTTPGVDSWAIVERADGHLCLYEDCADAIRDLIEAQERELAACRRECVEQARLNGAGSSREAALQTRLVELNKCAERLEQNYDALIDSSEAALAALRETLTRAAENMRIAAEFHDCVNCKEGHKQARTALAVARTIEKYDGALAALAQEP